MNLRLCLPALFSAALLAQMPPGPAPRLNDIQAYLNLTDAQITQLQQLRKNQAQSLQSVREQIRAKETALQQALSASGANPATVGQLVIDIQGLRSQVRQAQQSLNQQALALLTADQKTKLSALADAQKLMPDIGQAMALGLLVPPQPRAGMRGMGGMRGFGPGMGGPMQGGMGRGMGPGMMRMRRGAPPQQ